MIIPGITAARALLLALALAFPAHAVEPAEKLANPALEAALAHATADAARLDEDNRDLRAELAALDPAFFDEVEALKYAAAARADLLLRYEALLAQYAQALGVPFHPEPRP